MNVSFLIKIVGSWFVCIPLFLASAITSVLPFIVSHDLPGYFFHKGWIISFLGLSTVNFSISARRQYSRYKAFRAAWKDAAGESPRKEKATNKQQQNKWINWPVLTVMSSCMAVTYYLMTATLTLLQRSTTFADFVTAVRHDNDYLIAWLIWPLMFALEVFLLYRVFNRKLAGWTATKSQWLLIPVALITGGLFFAWATAAPGADEYPFYVLALVASGAVTLALYFQTQKKRAEKIRADNATIDGRRVPDSLVSISLAVPSSTPSPTLILAELPDYCMPLLRLQPSPAYPGIHSRGRSRAGVIGTAKALFEKLESFETTIQRTMESLSNNRRFKVAMGVAAAVIGITVVVVNERAESSLPGEHRQAVIQMEPAQPKPRALEASLSTSTPSLPEIRARIQTHATEDNAPRELTPAQNAQHESATENEAVAEDQTDNLFLYGLMYEEGSAGFQQSDSEAVKWYKLAAAQGNAKGETRLAKMYFEGRGGLPQSDSETVKWATKAASKNNAGGKALLGVMYILGRGGLTKDIDKGVYLLKQAARQGEPSAQRFLREIHVSWDE